MNKDNWLSGKTVTILGDSYSTFAGCVPEGNELYYPNDGIPDVKTVRDTWWRLLLDRTGMRLIMNDSYSGATVCTSVRPEHPISAAFVHRMKTALPRNGIRGEKPDVILLFGGTNDSWMEIPLGETQYDGWTDRDLKKALPAFCYMLHYVTAENPQARTFVLINTEMQPDYVLGIREACAHFGISSVPLHEIDKMWGHPTRLGMRQIADQAQAAIEKEMKE